MIYRIFSSIKTSVWLLGAMTACYVLGTVFPQGADIDKYIASGGRFVGAVKLLGLLNFFQSPLFLALTILLVLNLTVCIFDRYQRMKRRSELLGVESLLRAKNTFPITGIRDISMLEDQLLGQGFRLIDSSEDMRVFGRGLPYWWLSWGYHIGMVLAIMGCFVTFFTAFEGEVTLWPEKEQRLSLYSPDTRVNRLKKKLGFKVKQQDPEKEFTLKLREFRTDYYQTLRIKYPKNHLSRLALAAGYSKIGLDKQQGLYPKRYLTSFIIKTPDGKEIEATTMVNHPFRTGGLTLYQMGYDQRITLVINGKEKEVEIFKPFEIEGLKGKFMLKAVQHGRVFRKDGTTSEQKPRVELFRVKKFSRPESITMLYMDNAEDVQGVMIAFKDFKEASVLSYRVDPGVWIIGIAALFVFIGLCARVYGRFYRIRIFERQGRVFINISTRGLLADKDKVLTKIWFANKSG